MDRTAFIVNPHAGNGSTGRAWPSLAREVEKRLGAVQVHLTGKTGDALDFAHRCAERQFDRIVCVGGDGTLNEVVNGILKAGVAGQVPALGFIPNGTGCDFVRTVAIPRDVRRAMDLVAEGTPRQMDIGRLTFRDHRGDTVQRYFHNIASFGLGGEVDERVNRTTKAFGPFLSFIWATLISILCYGKKRIRVRTDTGLDREFMVWNVAVANGQYHGGGMWVAPGARIDDGRFHVTVIGDLSLVQVFRHMPKLYSGKIGLIDRVETICAARIEATSDEPVLLDVDGEQPGTLPMTAEIVPGALRIIAP